VVKGYQAIDEFANEDEEPVVPPKSQLCGGQLSLFD
jgi:hypothetical protein